MYTIQKLKPDRSIVGLIPAFSTLIIAALLAIFFGIGEALTFLAIVFWAYSIYTFISFLRTSNAYFLIPALYQFFAGFVLHQWETNIIRNGSVFAKLALLFMVVFLVGVFIVAAAKKIKWRGREILELAAAAVDETGNGYTSRPLPAGKIEFSRQEIMEFANFARRNLIAVSYIGKDRVILVPVMMGREFGFILGLRSDYTDETWIAFDFDGNVTVNISHRDYLEFMDALSFDQLCRSLSNLFIDFMQTYHRGEGVRIIARMDAVRVGIFS